MFCVPKRNLLLLQLTGHWGEGDWFKYTWLWMQKDANWAVAPLGDILPEYSHILDLLNFGEQPANQQPACHSCQFNTACVTADRNQTHLQRQTVGDIWRILEDTPPDCSHYQRTEIIRVHLQKSMNKKSHQSLLPPGWRWQFWCYFSGDRAEEPICPLATL